jgi:hypothetical protein
LAFFHAGGAWMDAFRLTDALRCALRARELAVEHRHGYDEARAEWLVRTTCYRLGTLQEPDLALVDAAADVGSADLEALVCFTEAATFFRLQDKSETIRLAERARRLWTGMKKSWAAMFARCLALAVGTGELVSEANALAKEATKCNVPGIGIQMVGLLAMGFPGRRLADEPIVEQLAAQVPRPFWNHRVDVLSVEEALHLGMARRGDQ